MASHVIKAKHQQIYPKPKRSGGVSRINSSCEIGSYSRATEVAFAQGHRRESHPPRRPTSWRYHPRPRDLSRKLAHGRQASLRNRPGGALALSDTDACKNTGDIGVDAAASASSVSPSWLQADTSTDVLLLATGVRGSSMGSAVDRGKRRSRSSSCSTTAISCASVPERIRPPLAVKRQQERNQQRPQHLSENLPVESGEQAQKDVTAATQDRAGVCTAHERIELEEKEEHLNSTRRVCIGDGLTDSGPSASTPTAPPAESGKEGRLVPRLLSFSSLRWNTRQREKSSPCFSSRGIIRHLPPPARSPSSPPSSSPSTVLLPTASRRGTKNTIRSSCRLPKFRQRTVRGKALVAVALACCATLEPAKGERDAEITCTSFLKRWLYATKPSSK